MKKSLLAFVLILAMTGTAGQAFAADYEAASSTPSAGTEMQRLELITTIVPSLRVSGTTASYTLYITCIASVNSIKATMQIQQLSGGKWVDYGSPWTATATTSFLMTNGTRTIVSGYSYRLKVDITASNGTATGTATVYS